jgi:hypothetical protein
MKKLIALSLIACLLIGGCQPATATQPPTVISCTDRGWADITISLYEFDRQLSAADPHADIAALVDQLEGVKNKIKDTGVDRCAENARNLIVAGLEDRIHGAQLISTGDDISARSVMRDGFRNILSANDELISLGIDLKYPK